MYRDQDGDRHICKSFPSKQKFHLVAADPLQRPLIRLEVKVNMVPGQEAETDPRGPHPVLLTPEYRPEPGEPVYG